MGPDPQPISNCALPPARSVHCSTIIAGIAGCPCGSIPGMADELSNDPAHKLQAVLKHTLTDPDKKADIQAVSRYVGYVPGADIRALGTACTDLRLSLSLTQRESQWVIGEEISREQLEALSSEPSGAVGSRS